MEKKLLSILFLLFAFFLNTSLGFGQTCSGTASVNISSSDTDNNICAGDSVTFTATPQNASANPTYQWRVNGVNQTGNGTTFTTSTLQNNHSVSVIMNPNCNGAPNVTSSSISTTVNPNPSVTTANTATICSGTAPDISLTASAPSTFSWTIGTLTGGITGASNGSGATINQTLTNPNNSTAGTVQYIVTPTTTAGSCTGEPYTITIKVNPRPTLTTANTATICSGTGPNISLAASTPSSFSWTIGTTTNGITGASAGNGSTINQTLTNSSSSTAGTVQYIVTPTATAGNCAGDPYTITVTVNPKPTVTTANTATICSGTGPDISLTASIPSSYSWTIGTITGGITGASNGSAATINQTLTNPSNSTVGTVQYIVTPTATTGGCPGTPQTITVTVNPRPSVTSTDTATICSGAGPNISLTASTPSSFSWIIGTISGGITGASNGSGATINQTLTNPSNSTVGTVQYIVTPTATTGGCPGTLQTITVTVNPRPSVTSADTATICSGAGPNILLTASTPSSFSWTVGTITGSITGASAGSGSTINQTLTNSSNSATGTVQYIVTPTATAGTCPGEPYTITVTVNPRPTVTTSNTAIVCSGFGPNISLTASAASSFSWTIGTISGGITGASASSGSTINQTLTNPSSSTAGTVQYIVTPTATAGTCAGTPYTITVNVNPTLVPSVSITSTSTAICTTAPTGSTPVTFTATPTNGGTNPTYQWKNNGNNISGQTGATYTANSLPNGSQISVVMTTTATCASTVTATSNVINMTGFTPPAAPVFSPAPSQAGSINTTLLCPPNTGLVYTVAADANVSSYNWTLPAGWVITAGAGTNSITINNSNLNAGTYNLVARAQNACGSNSTTLPVTINTAASVYAGADAAVCRSGSYNLSDAAVSGYINSNFISWSASPAGSGSFSSTTALNPTFTPSISSGTITLTLTSTKTTGNANCQVLTDQMILTVNAPPAIATQPSSATQTVCLNTTATQISVTATGAGLTYQWYSNTTNSNTGGTSINGATSATYTPVTTAPGTLYYYVIVSGTCASPVKSNMSGAVTVNAPPAITIQPSTTAQTVCLNATATQLSVTATGAGLTYQWYSNTTNSNSGGTSLGTSATSATYIPQTSTASTSYYYVVVSGTCTPAITSNVSGAVIVNSPPAITAQPSTTPQTLCPNSAATQLSVTATGAGVTYQWYSNTTNSNTGGTSLGASAISATYTPQTSTAGSSYYYVVVSGTCTPPVTSNVSGAVTVNEAPALTTQPSTTPQTWCLNDSATELSVTATGVGLTYQWYSNSTNSNSGGTSLGAGATSSTYAPATTSAGTLYYYVIVSGTCTPPVTSSVSGAVTVNSPPAITAQPSTSAQTLCLNTAAAQLSVTATGVGLTYQWYSNTTNSNSGGTSLGAGATSSTYTPLTNAAGSLYYYVIVSGTCTPPVTSDVSGVVTVNEAPALTTQPSTTPQTWCLNDSATELSVTATGVGLTYQWYSNTTNSNSGGTSLGASAISSTYTPVTNIAGTLYYYVIVIGTCNPPVTSNLSGAVNVNEPVSITTQPAASQTVCSGFPVSLTVTASGTGLTYEWFKDGVTTGITGATLNIGQAALSDDGTYKVIVKGAGPCGNVTSEEAVLIVNENIIINTQPASAEICENTNTSLSVTATGTGLTYQWRKGGIPISDGGTVSGTTSNTLIFTGALANNDGSYDVVISGTDDICSQTISNPAILKVNPKSIISLSSAAGTENQTICINSAITPITYAIEGGGTGASITAGALPAGVNGVYNSGVFTISGTPTESGSFTYTVTTTGDCANVALSGTINVIPGNTITLTSAAATTSQELCVNTAVANITYSTIGATGANFSGLPAGVNGSWANNTVTISGTPTIAGASSNYTVTLTGGCSVVTATGTITVKPDNTIALSSAAGTNAQSVCVNSALTNITYTTTGATSATVSGLPAGVTGSWSNNTLTISGTPTTAGGPSTYTITLTGGCSEVTTTGNITVTPINTVALSSATGTDAQSVCVNSPLTNITYTTTGATGADFSGLPAGVTGAWANNAVTISGTPIAPTAAGGQTTYTVTLTGGCSAVTTTGTITVNPNNTVTLSSAAATNAQSVCINAPLTNITYTTTGATGATLSGLPAGVTGAWANNTVTISGTPTTPTAAGGQTTYTVTLTGGCSAVTATGTINVKPNNTITLTSAASTNVQSVCVNTALTNITYTTTGATGATFSGLPAGITGSWANNTVTISGTPTAAGGPSTYTVTLTGGCSNVTATGTIKVDPIPVSGTLSFGTVGRIFMVCESPTESSLTPLTLSVITGQVKAWKYRKSSDTNWTTITENNSNFTGLTLTAAKIYSLGLNETISFQVEIGSGACTSVLSPRAILSVIPSDIEPAPVTIAPGVVCFGANVTLSSSTGYASGGDIGGGEFDSANSLTSVHGWRVRRDGSNTDLDFPAGGNNTRPNIWSNTNDHPFYTANITGSGGSEVRWDSGDKKFAIVAGNNPSTLETPVFNTYAMQGGRLTFDQAYNLTPGASIRVEISRDGGVTYESVPLYEVISTTTSPAKSNILDGFGNSTSPTNKISINLENYLGEGNLRIRFHFLGKKDGDVWALDAIDFPDGPNGVGMVWRDYTDPAAPITIGTNTSEQWQPKIIGWNTFEVRTTLQLNSVGQACQSIENFERVKAFVFDTYTVTASAVGGSCGNNSAKLGAIVVSGTKGAMVEFQTPGYTTPDGYTGKWEVTGPIGYTFSASHFLPAVNDPNSVFTPNVQGEFSLTWKLTPTTKGEDGNLIENSTCPPASPPIKITFQDCSTLDFDGTDDFVDLVKTYNDGPYSVEAWIKPEASIGTIISGPKFEITMGDLPPSIIPNTRWYHIAASNGRLYVDGIDIKALTLRNGSERAFIGAKWAAPNATNFFSGWIEEVRIWNGNISLDQIRFLMNQRLQNAGNIGVEIPMPAPGLAYSALAGYYQLLTTSILNGGYTPDLATGATNGKLRNMETLQENTAPLPYTSKVDGDWSNRNTWTQPVVWDFPNSTGFNGEAIDWNIVKTDHNIHSGDKDIIVLGLKSTTAGKLLKIAASDTEDEYNEGRALRITHYLLLNGNIDLIGQSQLLQDPGSILDEASAGWLERDQQGKRNSYVYNYWSSPVSAQGAANNALYSVGSILLDGTTAANPQTINFQAFHGAADGARTSPITVSTYWLWGYSPAEADVYAEWDHIQKDGLLKAGEGFTMKGTDGGVLIDLEQNYTFRGKPHNGDFDLTIAVGQNYLIGNPYPSSFDGREFIRNNLNTNGDNPDGKNVFDGSLYFWDHFTVVDHILKDYIGGYATYNLLDAVPAVTDDPRVDDSASNGTKVPGQYIPVGQGFMINSTGEDGGKIHFKNSQRIFQREDGNTSLFLRPEVVTKKSKEKSNEYIKIRLSFSSPMGYRRQILVGAVPHTTNGFDLGYDAYLFDDNVEDMYFIQDDNYLVIQGVPNFNADQVLPLGVKIKENKPFTIRIDTLENAPAGMKVYLKDKLNDSIHDLTSSAYNSTSEPGYIHDRFEIVFFKDEPPVVDPGEEIPGGEFVNLTITHAHDLRQIRIINPEEMSITGVYLFDLNGNLIDSYGNLPNEKEFKLNVASYATGVYLVKVYAQGKVITKKIIISN